MTTVTLEITLESPAVFSESAATTGNHDTLRYIPGRDLLGAAAARLYADAASEAQVDDWIFGGLRFSDGRPMHDGRPTVPLPLSWHQPKRSKNDHWYNCAVQRPSDQPVTQEKKHRELHVTDDGATLKVCTQATMRTAVSDDGRARDGLLFQFSHLTSGQRFLATVSGPDAAVNAAVRVLTSPGIRLGRSRSAEFGAVRVRTVDAPPPFKRRRTEQCVRVLLTSDLALLDTETGAPRLTPTPTDFGLGGECEIDFRHSFLRMRTYSPWHGRRGRPDVERQVISAGSVLVFNKVRDYGAIGAKEAMGIGLFRAEGLGTFIVDPEIIGKESFTPRRTARPTPADAPIPGDALGRWLERRKEQRRTADHAFEQAQRMVEAARHWRPSNAQWGNVREIARRHRHSPMAAAFFEELGRYTGAISTGESGKPVRSLSDKWGTNAAKLQEWAEQHGAHFVEVLCALVRNHKED
jgi:CRISPR-associated protein Csx10